MREDIPAVLATLIGDTRPDDLPALAAALSRALAETLRRVTAPPVDRDGEKRLEIPDGLLTIGEAAKRLGVGESWIYRHSKELPFTRKLGHRTLRFDARGLERWLKSREAAA